MAPTPKTPEQEKYIADVNAKIQELAKLIGEGARLGVETVAGFYEVPAASDAIAYREPRLISNSIAARPTGRSKALKPLNAGAAVVESE